MDGKFEKSLTSKKWNKLLLFQGKEAEMQQKKNDLEKQLEVAEVEAATVKNDLKLAMKRIEDLQTAITGELDSESYSDPGSDSSDEDIAVSTRWVSKIKSKLYLSYIVFQGPAKRCNVKERGGGRVPSLEEEGSRNCDQKTDLRNDPEIIILIVDLAKKCLSYDLQKHLTLVLSIVKYWCKPPTAVVSWVEQSAGRRR